MSLKGEDGRTLGVDSQGAKRGAVKPGANPGFLEASDEIGFEGSRRKEIYQWVTRTLCEQEYSKQNRATKGLLRQYIAKMTGRSRAQVTQLIRRYRDTGVVEERSYRRNRFVSRYTAADIELLAAVDEAHETLSGPATQKILYREFHDYGDRRYERLAAISVAHIYNLRKSRRYRGKHVVCGKKPGPVQVAIGERRRPDRKGNRAICASTRCTRGIGRGPKGCTTSMRSMR